VNLKYDRSFEKDISSIKDEKLLSALYKLILELKDKDSINSISNIKKLKSHKNIYRIKLGNYRLGFYNQEDTLVLVRFLHRKDIRPLQK
jgi:mRNA interferase RelE/StbE